MIKKSEKIEAKLNVTQQGYSSRADNLIEKLQQVTADHQAASIELCTLNFVSLQFTEY